VSSCKRCKIRTAIETRCSWYEDVVSVRRSLLALGVVAFAAACPGAEQDPVPLELGDDPHAYVTSRAYRRAILERDLVTPEPVYARVRLRHYAVDDPHGWDDMPEVDWATLPVTVEDAAHMAATQRLPELDFTTPPLGEGLEPDSLPSTREQWIALGERVFFEYPMSAAPSIGRALRAGVDLREYGLIEHDGAYVGVRFVDYDGRTGVAVTCASCHASLDEDGRPSGVRANREFEMARLRLDHGGAGEQHAVDTTAIEDLPKLGPGRSDVQNDGVFNPYAFADFGGIADMPYLHHTANWYNRGVATLAIRVETVFMNDGRIRSRPPRALMWALAEYLRSLPAPPPTQAPSLASERGRAVFEAQGCDACHTPPLYSSSERVELDVIGTDSAAGESPLRGTGYWRVPSLRGVGGNAPYLHHGAFATLEAMFDPERDEPGHQFGLDLDADDRADLLAFLRTI
jgi:mono/diheme cytochrome c family protein